MSGLLFAKRTKGISSFVRVGLFLLVAVLGVQLVIPQAASAAVKQADMNLENIGRSTAYYVTLKDCIYHNMHRTIRASSQSFGPTQVDWFNDMTAFGYVYQGGKSDCRDMMATALNLWDLSPREFLQGMGYRQSTANSYDWNGESDSTKRADAFASFMKSTLGTQEPNNPGGAAAYVRYMWWWQNKCVTENLGKFSSITDSIQKDRINSGHTSPDPTSGITTKYIKFKDSSGTENAYVYKYSEAGTATEYGATIGGGSFDYIAYGYNNNMRMITCEDTAKAIQQYGPNHASYQSDQATRNMCISKGFESQVSACMNGYKNRSNVTYCNTQYAPTTMNGLPSPRTEEREACNAGARITEEEVAGEREVIQQNDRETYETTEATPSTCVIEGTGWFVCSLSTTIAQAVDGIFSLLEGFLKVEPITTQTNGQQSYMYSIWQSMRSVANLMFVVSFLIIIFSQLSGVGVSNYGVKKLLPRLVVAAILVNISFWVCAIAVDVSNIAGAGIYDAIRDVTENSGNRLVTGGAVWEQVITGLLAGGGVVATAAGVVATAAAPGGVAAAGSAVLWAALPAVLTVLLAVIVCFAVLAARQGLIVILIILSPLAFVAMLLPNTEKLFTLWRKSLTTMLVFYPIFAILFSGSQLAGYIIITAASEGSLDSDPGMAMIILGLFVQAAPLALTPFLVRFSGGLIGQIAGRINDRSKGLIDRSRNVADRKRKLAMGEILGSKTPLNNRFARGTAGLLRKAYRRTQNGALRDADRQRAIDAENGAEYKESARGVQPLYNRINNANERQQTADNVAETNRLATADARAIGQALHNSKLEADTVRAEKAVIEKGMESQSLAYRSQAARSASEALDLRDKAAFKESLSTSQPVSASNPLAQTIADARAVELENNINRDRMTSAEGVLQTEYAKELQDRPGVAMRAGGIDAQGASRVTARAVQVQDEARAKAVAAEGVLLKDGTASTGTILSNIGTKVTTSGAAASSEQLEAMVKHVVENGTTEEVIALTNQFADPAYVSSVPDGQQIIKVLGEAVARSGKVKSIGGANFSEMSTGQQMTTIHRNPETGEAYIQVDQNTGAPIRDADGNTVPLKRPAVYQDLVYDTMVAQKYKPDSFAAMDIDELKLINKFLTSKDPMLKHLSVDARESFYNAIDARMNDPRLSSSLNERDKKVLLEMQTNMAALPDK